MKKVRERDWIGVILLVCFVCLMGNRQLLASQSNENVEEQGPTFVTTDIYEIMGSQIEIPVLIKNNPGIMGLGIQISYDPKLWKPVKTERGELLSEGTFTDNIDANKTDGTLRILWSDTGEMKSDGKLLEVTFEAIKAEIGISEIRINCSKPDTFREDWTEVDLGSVVSQITIQDGSADYAQNAAKEIMEQAGEDDSRKEQIADAVQKAVEEAGYKKMSEVPDEDKTMVVAKATDYLKEAGAELDDETPSFETLSYLADKVTDEKKDEKIDQSGQVKEKVLEVISKEETGTIIKKALEQNGADSFEGLSDEQKGKVFDSVKEELRLKGIDLNQELEGYSTQEKLEILKMLYEDVTETKTLTQQKEELREKNEKTGKETTEKGFLQGKTAAWGAAGLAVIIILVLIGIYIKKKQK